MQSKIQNEIKREVISTITQKVMEKVVEIDKQLKGIDDYTVKFFHFVLKSELRLKYYKIEIDFEKEVIKLITSKSDIPPDSLERCLNQKFWDNIAIGLEIPHFKIKVVNKHGRRIN
jgi:hypothetical protein